MRKHKSHQRPLVLEVSLWAPNQLRNQLSRLTISLIGVSIPEFTSFLWRQMAFMRKKPNVASRWILTQPMPGKLLQASDSLHFMHAEILILQIVSMNAQCLVETWKVMHLLCTLVLRITLKKLCGVSCFLFPERISDLTGDRTVCKIKSIWPD